MLVQNKVSKKRYDIVVQASDGGGLTSEKVVQELLKILKFLRKLVVISYCNKFFT